MSLDWSKEIPYPITICDTHGIILYMNQAALEQFSSHGGVALLGTDLLNCHPEPARSKLAALLDQGGSNIYAIEKNGKRTLIVQAPWRQEGVYAGLVEFAIPLPEDLPLYRRDQRI